MDLDLLDLDMFQRGEQDEAFAPLRRQNPVSWRVHPLGRGFWSVVRNGDVVTVNRDASLFSSEVGSSISLLDPDERANGVGADTRGAMMIASDPPRHTRYRRLVNSGFTPRTMKAIEESLAVRATMIIDQVIEKGSCDLVTEVAAELPLQAIADIMGVPQEDRGRLFDWSNRMVGLDDPEYASTDGSVATAEMDAYVNDLARQRRADPRDDIVTVLVKAKIDGDSLSEVEFDMFMLLLTLAGNETTRNSTSWCLGAYLARMQLRLVIGEIVGRIPDMQLAARPSFSGRTCCVA